MGCECGCTPGVPMQVQTGNHPNPHVQYGQDDIVPYPVTIRTFLHFAGAQMRNGVDQLAYPTRLPYKAAGYSFGQIPRIPGMDRRNGSQSSDFIPRGGSTQQWDYHLATGPGMQPSAPGGPGQTTMGQFRNPGSGA